MNDDELRGLIELLRQENAAAHAETRRENAAKWEENAARWRENASAHEETRRTMREENASAHEETRRHFDVTAEAMRHEIGIISERVIRLDEKVDHLDEKMDRRFAEVEYAHIKLEARVTAVEKR